VNGNVDAVKSETKGVGKARNVEEGSASDSYLY